MATATKKEILPVPVAPKVEITLVLSLDEATTLRDIMYLVGGDPKTSRRRYARSVMDALTGVSGRSDAFISDVSATQRVIWFL